VVKGLEAEAACARLSSGRAAASVEVAATVEVAVRREEVGVGLEESPAG
jgi:hypothetical protein